MNYKALIVSKASNKQLMMLPMTAVLRIKMYSLLVILFTFNFQVYGQSELLLRLPDKIPPEDRICFALYTVHDKPLKLTAQFYPIKNFEPFYTTLEIEQNGGWLRAPDARIIGTKSSSNGARQFYKGGVHFSTSEW